MGRKFSIDHRILFFFGFFFYLVTPYVVGSTSFFDALPGVILFRDLFRMVPESQLAIYWWTTIGWAISFILGHYAFYLVRIPSQPLQKFPSSQFTRQTNWIGYFLLVLLMLFAFRARASLFGGYASYDIGARGKLSTLLMICNFFLLYQSVSRQKRSFAVVAATVGTSLLLLSMGGRLYVFQTIIICLIYKTSFSDRRWSLFHAGLALLFFAPVAASFGLWRIGLGFGLQKLLYSVAAEPTFTWFSTAGYLAGNELPYFNFPSNFLTSFLNMVPNTLISLKPYIVSTNSMVNDYKSPLGGDSIWSTLVINFGTIGSCFFIFITAFLLHFLRKMSSRGRFWAVYYMLVCGLLPFQIFRDGFYLIHKQLYFNFLLFPAFLLAILKLILVAGAAKDRKMSIRWQ